MDRSGAPAARPVVVVVDDEPLLRLQLVDALGDCGFEGREAGSGDDALDLLRVGGISAVITDRRMPGRIDGDGLARVIADRWPAIPVIMMSGQWPRPEDTTSIAEFFPKPVDVPALCRLLEKLLGEERGEGPA